MWFEEECYIGCIVTNNNRENIRTKLENLNDSDLKKYFNENTSSKFDLHFRHIENINLNKFQFQTYENII